MALARRSSPPSPSLRLRRTKTRRSRRGALSILFPRTLQMMSSLPQKERSRKCLHSNPNSYFYRHVEPGLEQWGGDWKEEEIRAFCLTAQQFGCGDKWGLFSSYIPHRVGYQVPFPFWFHS